MLNWKSAVGKFPLGKSHKFTSRIKKLYRVRVNTPHSDIFYRSSPPTYDRIINIPQFTKINLFYNFHSRTAPSSDKRTWSGTQQRINVSTTPRRTILLVNISTLAARQTLNVFCRLLLAFIFHSIKVFREHVFDCVLLNASRGFCSATERRRWWSNSAMIVAYPFKPLIQSSTTRERMSQDTTVRPKGKVWRGKLYNTDYIGGQRTAAEQTPKNEKHKRSRLTSPCHDNNNLHKL